MATARLMAEADKAEELWRGEVSRRPGAPTNRKASTVSKGAAYAASVQLSRPPSNGDDVTPRQMPRRPIEPLAEESKEPSPRLRSVVARAAAAQSGIGRVKPKQPPPASDQDGTKFPPITTPRGQPEDASRSPPPEPIA